MQTVLALIATTKTAFANFDDVAALGRCDHRTQTILLQKDRVIARGDLKAIRIIDRYIRIEEVVQVGMPQPFELDGADDFGLQRRYSWTVASENKYELTTVRLIIISKIFG